MNEFVKERHDAFVSAVVDDDWSKIRKYSKKYDMPLPKDRKVMKAGIYKACQYCTDISEDVKDLAMRKCLELGFIPFIEPIEESESE